MQTVLLFNFRFISDTSFDNVVSECMAHNKESCYDLPLLVTPNVDQVVKLQRHENYDLCEKLLFAKWILPDGQPLIWLSKLIYGSGGLKKRLTGSDFFPVMWAAIKTSPKRAFFILPNAQLAEAFMKEHDGVVCYAPPYFNLNNPKERDEVFDTAYNSIKSNDPDFLFVGLGFPKQEQMALHLLDRLRGEGLHLPVTMLLGASFEFYFGTKSRAPKIFQRMGLEFLHRLLTEPKRMFRRYLVDDIAFFPLAVKEYKKRKQV